MAKKKYTVISLFSGGMGLDIGLHSTDRYHLLACIEKDHACCETIRLNRDAGRLNQNLKVLEGSIENIKPEDVLNKLGIQAGEVDLIVGGPPCQSFSTAGKRGTIQDPRGTLLWQFLHYVEVIKPKFFLMENVRGLVSAALRHRPIAERPNKGGPPLTKEEEPGSVLRAFAEDLKTVQGASYHMDCFEVNAVNYGAPQLRERVLFIGNRYNAEVEFPEPTHIGNTEENKQRSLFELQTKKRWKTLRDAIGDLRESDPIIMDFSPRKKKYLSMVPEGSNWRSLPTEIQQESMGKAWFAKGGRSGWWRRLTLDLPCPTLMTCPNHASTSLCHPTETRALSIKEYARIQEFPDEWEFFGKVSEQYKQIGNAVPTRLGLVAGNVIGEELDLLSKRNWKPYQQTPENYRVVYIQSHIRTRQWYKSGETLVWENKKSNKKVTYKSPKTLTKTKSISN